MRLRYRFTDIVGKAQGLLRRGWCIRILRGGILFCDCRHYSLEARHLGGKAGGLGRLCLPICFRLAHLALHGAYPQVAAADHADHNTTDRADSDRDGVMGQCMND